MHDVNTVLLVIDAVDDPVAAASSGAQTSEVAVQGTAKPVGVLRQRAEDELQACRPDLLGQPSEISFCASGDPYVARRAHPEV